MKIKLVIYGEQAQGAMLTVLMDPIITEINEYSQLKQPIIDAISKACGESESTLMNLISASEIEGWSNIIDIQVYLRSKGYVLLIGEVTDVESTIAPELGGMLEVVSPKYVDFPVISTYFAEQYDFNVTQIIEELESKFDMNNLSIIPESNMSAINNSIKELEEAGAPIVQLMRDAQINELVKYGFQVFVVRVE